MPRGRRLGHSRLLDHRPSAARSWGAGVRVFFWGTRTELSTRLFRENLCSPGVLPELLLLLGSLPRWGETGNSLRFRERYGQGGGDGGERLPGGPPGEAGTARRFRGGTVGSRTPAAAIRARPPEHPGSAGARRGGAVLAPARAPCRGQGRPLGASVQRTPSSGTRTVAARRSAPAWQWMSWAANPRVLGKNRLTAPEFFRPQPRGRLGV